MPPIKSNAIATRAGNYIIMELNRYARFSAAWVDLQNYWESTVVPELRLIPFTLNERKQVSNLLCTDADFAYIICAALLQDYREHIMVRDDKFLAAVLSPKHFQVYATVKCNVTGSLVDKLWQKIQNITDACTDDRMQM